MDKIEYAVFEIDDGHLKDPTRYHSGQSKRVFNVTYETTEAAFEAIQKSGIYGTIVILPVARRWYW